MQPCSHTVSPSALAVAYITGGVSHTLRMCTPVIPRTLRCLGVPEWETMEPTRVYCWTPRGGGGGGGHVLGTAAGCPLWAFHKGVGGQGGEGADLPPASARSG